MAKAKMSRFISRRRWPPWKGCFEPLRAPPIVLIGQPNPDTMQLDNPLIVPNALSLLTYRRWKAEVKGLDAFPRDQWPDNIPLLYYCYHIMVGLGTIFVAIMGIASLQLLRGRLCESR